MSRFDTRESAPRGEDAFQTIGSATDRLQDSRRTPNQRERVRRMLSRGWVCSVEFISSPPDGYAPILRYTGRIHELRRDGWLIDRRTCSHGLHNHGKGVQLYQWHIVGHVDDGKLPGIGDV